MKELFLILTLLLTTNAFSQDGIMLSQENANEKGITPMWPKCDRSRQTPIQCFNNQLRTHIIKNFEYPEVARKEALEGTVNVEFMIDKKGKVEILEVTGAHRYLQQEGIRIIRRIPKMEPAKWGNKPIAIVYKVPITFLKPQ
ncbi:energy transducer TonB [Aquimarina intermedia]|uniref:Protein TonB n=1 Tax=Aquimarina intermedia TaxID=350814 RepID=A0A5S5C9B6_9FLAO|nr:energy transducer TonB [Aquimarina intermedia]TYP75934.1 protein TonB [Aquimarina intermedia]